MSGKNRYRKAMLRAYWIPLLIFFGIPCGVILISAESISMVDAALLLLPFPVAIFASGYLLAPYFGPRATENKFQSFLMAEICLVVALAAFVGASGGFSSDTISFSLGLIGVLLIFGIFPVILAGLLFAGACEDERT